MNIIGIDPGPTHSAGVWIEIKHGVSIVDSCYQENDDFLNTCRKLYGFSAPKSTYVVIEQVKSYGMAVSDSIFDTVFWTGQIYLTCKNAGLICSRLPRMAVKMAICHDSRAKDANIRQAIIDRFPATGGGKTPEIGTKKRPGPLYGIKGDMWAALGVALAYADEHAAVPA